MSLNLQPTHLLTIGAVIFAGFAIYEVTKKPGGAVSSQPGQAARDSALTDFNNLLQSQGNQFSADPSSTAALGDTYGFNL